MWSYYTSCPVAWTSFVSPRGPRRPVPRPATASSPPCTDWVLPGRFRRPRRVVRDVLPHTPGSVPNFERPGATYPPDRNPNPSEPTLEAVTRDPFPGRRDDEGNSPPDIHPPSTSRTRGSSTENPRCPPTPSPRPRLFHTQDVEQRSSGAPRRSSMWCVV